MSAYSETCKQRYAQGMSNWDLAEPRNRRELFRLRFRAWYWNGPRTIVFGLSGCLIGSSIGIAIGTWIA